MITAILAWFRRRAPDYVLTSRRGRPVTLVRIKPTSLYWQSAARDCRLEKTDSKRVKR
jgi:hypothetical protein